MIINSLTHCAGLRRGNHQSFVNGSQDSDNWSILAVAQLVPKHHP